MESAVGIDHCLPPVGGLAFDIIVRICFRGSLTDYKLNQVYVILIRWIELQLVNNYHIVLHLIVLYIVASNRLILNRVFNWTLDFVVVLTQHFIRLFIKLFFIGFCSVRACTFSSTQLFEFCGFRSFCFESKTQSFD